MQTRQLTITESLLTDENMKIMFTYMYFTLGIQCEDDCTTIYIVLDVIIMKYHTTKFPSEFTKLELKIFVTFQFLRAHIK